MKLNEAFFKFKNLTLLLFCARLPKNNLILKRVAYKKIDFRNVIA